jgi:DNA-binding NarL/FixJ family response regulator
MRVRLVFVEDSVLVRAGVQRMLEESADIDLVAVCVDAEEARLAIDEQRPDVVLTDIRMPPTHTDEGIRLAEHCRRHHPATGVILLSQYVEVSYVKTLLAQGTEGRGYLLKERIAHAADLLDAVRTVHDGGSAIDPKVVSALVAGRSRAGDASLARLSRREREVLAGIAQGRTNTAIAAQLVITVHAVEKHVNSIFAKLGLSGDQATHPRVRAALLYLADEHP